ncbi:MAG: hypothetical protein K2X27_16410 [Candidatus Obscuribacterales bacterium]|nr:hypothetical protein [Candidatus Obscuribacterales bacterium]
MATKAANAGLLILRFGLIELLIVLSGLVFVRKEIYLSLKFGGMILHWQEYALLFLVFLDGLLRGKEELQNQGQYLSPFRRKYLRYLLPFTLFLYVSCSSLCDKLNAACIQEEYWRNLGLLILLFGLFLHAYSQKTRPKELFSEMSSAEELAEQNSGAKACATADSIIAEKSISEKDTKTKSIAEAELKVSGPWKILRYPAKTAMLIELMGISMSLSAWMPLLTLPGLCVMLKWELADLEAFRISQLGKSYLNYREKTWTMIPYLY